MKPNLNKIKKTIKNKRSFLEKAYGVKGLGIFGSVARGENTSTSDIDMLVEFSKPIGLIKFIELENFLSKTAGKKVDLVTKKALKPAIKKEILREVIYV